jgi:hypothetical protein
VNHALGNGDGLSVLERLQVLGDYLPLPELLEQRPALLRWQTIYPQETTRIPYLARHAVFGQRHIMTEGFDGNLLQLRRSGDSAQCENAEQPQARDS